MSQTVQFIRDEIVIDGNSTFLSDLQSGDTLRLIAAKVTLTETFNLKGRNLEIYVATFVASAGAALLNQGMAGTVGSNGANGTSAAGTEDGSPGGPGISGGNGTNGGMVKIVAEVMKGLEVNVKGGDANSGGIGGAGGRGGTLTIRGDRDPTGDHLLPQGGRGGPGGPGGYGGSGGTVILSSVTYDTDPVIDVSGGNLGQGGIGGKGGAAGVVKYTGIRPIRSGFGIGRPAFDGPSGPNGEIGLAGTLDKNISSYADFWSSMASETFAFEWAKYRHAVGEFYFRSYVPGLTGRDHYIGMAVDELQAALRLNPNQSESINCLEQIWNNMNPLGLPRNLDVFPRFKEYIGQYIAVTNLLATFASIGTGEINKANELNVFRAIFTGEKKQSIIRTQSAQSARDDSLQEEKDVAVALLESEKMIESVRQQIESAKEEMKKKPLTFLGVVGNVAEIAIAVSAVMAAVPTGGVSLLALYPDAIAFSKTVYDNAAPLAQLIMDHEQNQTLAVAKDQYNMVKKDTDGISKTSTKVLDLLKVINKIRSAKTTDNSKLMGLVQKAAELAYEHLLKQQELTRAQMRTKTLEQTLVSERDLQTFHDAEIKRTTISEEICQAAGLKIQETVFSEVDLVLGMAFRAQRSIEIYLLKDQSRSVFYDVSRVHPDIAAASGPRDVATLSALYQVQFAALVNPAAMWATYDDYFDNELFQDIIKLSFTDPETLDLFRQSSVLSFSFDAANVPEQRYDTKLLSVNIALIGAKTVIKDDVVTCNIEHGGVYSERTSNGLIQETISKARRDHVRAPTTRLPEIGSLSTHPLDDPQNSPLWGMGIGGLYTITISNGVHSSFESLTEIQVWLMYRYRD